MDQTRKPDIEERIAGLHDGVAGADATGMVADEELVTRAETLLPLQALALPHETLHAALPQAHPAHATIDRLQAEVRSSKPGRTRIEGLVGELRAVPELEVAVANWWENPATQRLIWNLSQIGL